MLFGRKSRTDRRVEGNLGVIKIGSSNKKILKYRSPELEQLDKYYEDRAYNNLMDWFQACKQDEHVPIRNRKPYIRYNLAKVFASRVSSKLVGRSVWPNFTVEDDPDTTYYIGLVIKASYMQAELAGAMRRMASSGSALVRFMMNEGSMKLETYNPNHCYPEFLPNGELSSCKVQYVYKDTDDLDENGKPREKWFRMDLGQMQDVLYDNPEYREDAEPVFTPVNQIEHGLGFVQAEWFRSTESKFSPDGYGLTQDIMPFNDELNYSLSQSAQAVGYNQDPQLLIKGLDEDEVDLLVRSSQKGWNMGREGDAAFLETSLSGVERSIELRDKVRLAIQDVTRVVLLDPEKVVGHAQSGRAMEVLHAPFVELIEELRPQVEKSIIRLVTKIAITNLMLVQKGLPAPIQVPAGYKPKSMSISVDWPPVFPQTVMDLTQKVQMVAAATSANLISRETGTRKLAKDFGVEDIESELQKIADQPVINPFGAF